MCASEPVLHHQPYFTWFNFCLSQRICCNLHSPRLLRIFLFLSFFFFFLWIIMRYIIFASSWHSARVASSISLHVFEERGKQREKRKKKVLAFRLSWPGRGFGSLYLWMPNLWKFDVLVSYFGGILLYLFAHNLNTCPQFSSSSSVCCRCSMLAPVFLLFFSRSDRASKLAPK